MADGGRKALVFGSSSFGFSFGSMPHRDEKGCKFNRWRVYFAKESLPKVRSWKNVLKCVISKRAVAIEVNDVSPYAVEIVWTDNPVAYDSAARLMRMAVAKDKSFQTLGLPRGVAQAESASCVVQKRRADPVGDSTTASSTVAAAPARTK